MGVVAVHRRAKPGVRVVAAEPLPGRTGPGPPVPRGGLRPGDLRPLSSTRSTSSRTARSVPCETSSSARGSSAVHRAARCSSRRPARRGDDTGPSSRCFRTAAGNTSPPGTAATSTRCGGPQGRRQLVVAARSVSVDSPTLPSEISRTRPMPFSASPRPRESAEARLRMQPMTASPT